MLLQFHAARSRSSPVKVAYRSSDLTSSHTSGNITSPILPFDLVPRTPGKVLPIRMPTKRRILCVDDHADICDLVSTVLEDFEVVAAQSKTEGLRRVQSGLFDLYLLDYSLPDGTGLELATLIRQFDDSTPILMITSPHTLTDRQVSEVAAQGLVSKDDLPEDLLKKVRDILALTL